MLGTSIFIIWPSLLCCLVISESNYFSSSAKIVVYIVYALSFSLSIGNLLKCAFSDPGIIPKIHKIENLDQNCSYQLLYRDENELDIGHLSPVQQFYSQKKFKLNSEQDSFKLPENERMNRIVYCRTCDILRPPRSFHCSTCGVCIEIQDHHCPFVGTCIAYRNVRYFIGFLFFTSTHSLITFAINLPIWLA